MAEVGKVTPGSPVITRVPRDRPATDEKEHQQEPDENNENRDNEEDEHNESNKEGGDNEGGIDLYV
jgi:hypothetical protein